MIDHNNETESPRLHFVVPCMGRLEFLQETIGSAIGQSCSSYTLVDYSCPDNSGVWVSEHYPLARIVQIAGRKYWHASEARNAGARTIASDWICFLDADVTLSPSFSKRILSMARSGRFFTTEGAQAGICGLLICSQKDFAACGGYDENIEGWGWEDLDLRMSLRRAGLIQEIVPNELIHHINHNNTLRSQNCRVTNQDISHRINRLYVAAKDAMLQSGRHYDSSLLSALYRRIAGGNSVTLKKERTLQNFKPQSGDHNYDSC